jgi:rhamnosyltransferase
MNGRVALVIPTRNAGAAAGQAIAGIHLQTTQPDAWLVIDSGSNDGTAQTFAAAGAVVLSIDPASFDHGGTRRMAVDQLTDADFVVFLTQDAVLADPQSLEHLIRCFDDLGVAAAYGRQLPRPGAGAIERHARQFNYPGVSQVRSLADARTLGIRAAFCSNTFAAWRRSALLAAGGFPSPCILGEDMLAAARLLQAGSKVAYCADACVVHSHGLSVVQEARRYFDTGVMHADNPWLSAAFGSAGGEGRRFVGTEIGYLATHGALLRIPEAVFRDAVKLGAYRMGRLYRRLPQGWCRRMSMNPSYWDRMEGRHDSA